MKNEKLFAKVSDYLNKNLLESNIDFPLMKNQIFKEIKSLKVSGSFSNWIEVFNHFKTDDLCLLYLTVSLITSPLIFRGITFKSYSDGNLYLIYSTISKSYLSHINWKLREFSGDRIRCISDDTFLRISQEREPEWELKIETHQKARA